MDKTITHRFKFRIYPTKDQEIQILKTFGSCRFVYNHFLAERISRYNQNAASYSYYEMSRDLTQLKKQVGFEWLADADAAALHNSLKNLDCAFSNFFKRLDNGASNPGFPKFKSKRNTHQSYTNRCSDKILLSDKKIRLPKVGWVDCRFSKRIVGRLLNATVIRYPSGKFFVSLCFANVSPVQLPPTGASVGLSLGLNVLLTSSDGLYFADMPYSTSLINKITRLRRELSRKSKDSANYEKTRIKLAKAIERLSNQKSDLLHKLTSSLVRNYDLISIRDEPVAQMLSSSPLPFLAAFLYSASWAEIIRQLEYKCLWYGKQLVKIPCSFPTSQTCSACGFIFPDVRSHPSWSSWLCPVCNAHHDRAVNAAINILALALPSRAS